MNQSMTAAQRAQQTNRTNDGRYTTKSHSEADTQLAAANVSRRRNELESLYEALSDIGVQQMHISSDDGGQYYVSSITPDNFYIFDDATDLLAGTDLTWSELCSEDGEWTDGKDTITLDIGQKMQQVNEQKFSRIAQTPTSQDMDKGYEAAFQQMQAEGHEIVRDTPENEAKLRQAVDAHPRYSTIAKMQSQAQAHLESYGRAYEQGVPIDPVDESNFEKAWSGELKDNPDHLDPSVGFSQQDFQRNLATCRQDRQRIENGSLSPRELMGQGVSRQQALDAIDHDIATMERALKTRGRSYHLNVNAVEKMR
jgi:hypothetical protein